MAASVVCALLWVDRANAAAAPPTADQVLAEHIDALGGREILTRITSFQAKGRIHVPSLGIDAKLESVSKPPNKRLSTVEVPGFGLILDGFDGVVAWSQSPMTGITEKAGDELERLKREAVFHRELKLKETFASLTYRGSTKVGDRDTDVVEAKPRQGLPESFYFDKKTHLLLRHDSCFEADSRRTVVEVMFSDYRDVDKTKVPFQTNVRVVSPNGNETTFQMTYEEVKHNERVDDVRFVKPSSGK